jgi:hypothetical protein
MQMDKHDAGFVGDCFSLHDGGKDGFCKMDGGTLVFIMMKGEGGGYYYIRDRPEKFKVGFLTERASKAFGPKSRGINIYQEKGDVFVLKFAGSTEDVEGLKEFLPGEVQQIEIDDILVIFVDKSGKPIT